MVHITVILSGMILGGHSECHSVILIRVLVFPMECHTIPHGIRVIMVIPLIHTDGDTTLTCMVTITTMTDTIMEITTDTTIHTVTAIRRFITDRVVPLRITGLQQQRALVQLTAAGLVLPHPVTAVLFQVPIPTLYGDQFLQEVQPRVHVRVQVQ